MFPFGNHKNKETKKELCSPWRKIRSLIKANKSFQGTVLYNVIIQLLKHTKLNRFWLAGHHWPIAVADLVLVDCKWGIWTFASHEESALRSDTCIPPGGECQRMLGDLLHMWSSFLSCSPLFSHSSDHLPLPGSPCSWNKVRLKAFCWTRSPFHLFAGIPACWFFYTGLSGQWHLVWCQCSL